MMEIKINRLVVILICYLILVMSFSWVPGMFMDGLLYSALSKNLMLNNTFPKLFLSTDFYPEFWEHPPFIIAMQAIIFKLFGASWTTAKLTNVIWGMGLLSLMWWFLNREFSRKHAFIATAIFLLTYPFIKSSRFPNMDVALTFFFFASFVQYYFFQKTKEKKYWLYLGIFFGLGLLMKGHPALFIAFSVGVHLIVVRDFRTVFSPYPWVALLIGAAIFGIWPLMLFITGNIHGFERWFSAQFLATVLQARNQTEYSFFTYFLNLLKAPLPWFLLFLCFTFCKLRNLKKSQALSTEQSLLSSITLSFFWPTLLALSCVKFKYGHYITPIYPFMAIGAMLVCYNWKYVEKFFSAAIVLVLLCGVLMLSFPLTNEVKREKNIHEAITYLNNMSLKFDKTNFTNLVVVNDAMPLWAFIGSTVFSSPYNPRLITSKNIGNTAVVESGNCPLLEDSLYQTSIYLLKDYQMLSLKGCFFSSCNGDKKTYYAFEAFQLPETKDFAVFYSGI